ncbi:CheY-like protein, partial [Suhomyces tanzawaensis NRRL Y-17324]
RRVWVKRPNGTPTTISVHQQDIVDDLKLAIINKFPTSLARSYDPADLIIKIHPRPASANTHKKNIPLFSFPDVSRSPNSPLATSTSYAITTLEPDQNVWVVLDNHFPKGMTMQDSFIIEVPELDPLLAQHNQNFSYYNQPPLFPLVQLASRPVQPPQDTKPSISFNTSPKFHQPQPQYGFQASINNNKDLSISPEITAKQSPAPSNIHKGLQATTSSSPAPELAPPSASAEPTSSAGSDNSQVVLLLPKNFSLAAGNQPGIKNIQDPHKKRLSFDEGLISKPRTDFKSPPTLSTNLTSIGMADNHPTPFPLTVAPEKKKEIKPFKEILKKKSSKSSGAKTNTERVLPSISVLVVEDNAINQAILGAFLRKHRIHYQIAKNGQEAIDKWRTGGFHLVLMDIQLPVKSGIEATKEIRHLEKVNRIGVFAQHELTNSHYHNQTILKPEEKLDLNIFRSPVIIVALTASSNSSVDKKNALMAGCNDYLTKPVNLVWLQNKITEWGCMQALIDFEGWRDK